MEKENKGNINILILSCGRRVELVKLFTQARDSLGISGNIICCDNSIDAPALWFGDKKRKLPSIADNDFLKSLIRVAKDENVKLIIPTIDTELSILAENAEMIERESGAKVMVSDKRCIDICRDKYLTAKFLKECKILIPKTLTTEELIDYKGSFPLFIKPKDGSSSINAFKVNCKKELDFFKNYIKNPIVQEFIEGVEYTVDIFCDFNGNLISCIPRKRLATRGGEVLKGKVEINDFIVKQSKLVIETLKPIGPVTLQGILRKDNTFIVIEINPRYGGGAPMSIKSGANSCAWIYQLLCGRKIAFDIKDVKQIEYARFDDSIEVGND